MPAVAGLPCAGCREMIRDRYYLLAMGRQWHMRCLTCCECGLPLDCELSCYVRQGNVYCRNDYDRLFRWRHCPRCLLAIPADELVLRAGPHVYHTHCFTCAACNKPLNKGEHFGLRGDAVYCRQHYGALNDSDDAETLDRGMCVSGRDGHRTRKSNPSTNAMKAEAKEKTCAQTSPETSAAPQRTKRLRTTFKHQQLRAMKSFFATNQNPDSKDLKHLAQKTGLNKRVLQVWFQNARAKHRRSCLRQDKYILQQVRTDPYLSLNDVNSPSTSLRPLEECYFPMVLPFPVQTNPLLAAD